MNERKRRKGRPANYQGASPEQVAKALHRHRPDRNKTPERRDSAD